MNIGVVGRGVSLERARSAGATGNQVGQPRSVSDTSVDGQGVNVSLSKPVQMISQLEDLKKNDFESFSKTLTDSAKALQRAAEEAEGEESEQLSAMASSFANAAATGDLTALQPPAKAESDSKRESYRDTSREVTGDAGRELTGYAGRALHEYAKNTPERPRPSESVERAMSATFNRVEQATRAAAVVTAPQTVAQTSLYA